MEMRLYHMHARGGILKLGPGLWKDYCDTCRFLPQDRTSACARGLPACMVKRQALSSNHCFQVLDSVDISEAGLELARRV
jgi:hypothetical protein